MAVLHRLLLDPVARLHANLRRDHVLRRVFDILARFGPLHELRVVDSLLVA